MDIYNRLPEDIQKKMFIYFRHPVAQQLHDNWWVIPQIINNWPPPPTTEYRLALARMVDNPTTGRHRCGCIYYEQHQVCCNDIPEEELDSWDPVIHTTPILQAIQKSNMCVQIKNQIRLKSVVRRPYGYEVKAMLQEN